MQVIKDWFKCYFSDPEAIFLTVLILFIMLTFTVMGNILVPIIASIIIAYLLTGCVDLLKCWKFPHLLAVIISYLLFIGIVLVFFIWLLPLLFQQLTNLFAEIPKMLANGQSYLVTLQAKHPDLFSAGQLKYMLGEFGAYLSRLGQFIVSFSLTSISNVITVIVYLILVPLLTFFFLKDREQIVTWLQRFLPKKHYVLTNIWQEVNLKIGDYIRGKFIEILIVAFVSVVAFLSLGLNYAILLGVGVGLSVVIPYIGAIVITVPVVLVAFFEWGWSAQALYLLIAYIIIVILDANLLVPLLFSEKMKLHPVIIVIAVLFFGGLWGFWGVFFAIPLATLVNALLKNWPRVIEKRSK